MQNLIPKFKKEQQTEENHPMTDQQIIQYWENIEQQQKIPKQQIQTITIKGQQIPTVIKTVKQKNTGAIGTQGILCIHKKPDDNRTLKTIIREHTDTILEEYQKTNKKLTQRTHQQYLNIVQKHLKHYQQKLNLPNIKIKHQYMVLNKLGYATKHNTITLNQYLQYMEERIIQYTIYHELCHIYTYKHHKTLSHGEQFQNILYQEYTPEQEKQIIEH